MDEIFIVKSSIEYENEIYNFREEIIKANDYDSFAGCGSLKECEKVEEWLDRLKQLENIETCPKGYVTSNTYLTVRKMDNRIIGISDIRDHIDHPILGTWGGHIGYTIRPSERLKGYGKRVLRLTIEIAKSKNIDKLMITCNRNNIASEKIIISNNGIYEKDIMVDGDVIKRYWIEI